MYDYYNNFSTAYYRKRKKVKKYTFYTKQGLVKIPLPKQGEFVLGGERSSAVEYMVTNKYCLKTLKQLKSKVLLNQFNTHTFLQ